jgi:hypothetical protein
VNYKEKNKLYDICYKSKKGIVLPPEDLKFTTEMFDKYPEEYKEVSTQAVCEAMNSVGGNQFVVVNGEITRK